MRGSRKLLWLFCTWLLLEAAVPRQDVFATGKEPMLTIHQQEVKTDVAPWINNHRVMVPLRVISEHLGYHVSWDQNTKEVRVSDSNVDLKLSIGKKEVIKNHRKEILEVAPVMKDNRTFVPLRYIAETFHQVVIWDDLARTVHITREMDRPRGEDDVRGRFILVNNRSFPTSKEKMTAPQCGEIGDVGLILKSEGDDFYVDFIKPQGEATEDWSFAKGYVLKKDCILNPTAHELSLISRVCRLKHGQISVQDAITGKRYAVDGGNFVKIEKREQERFLIDMPGGANRAWVSKKDIDFLLEYFTGNPNNA